jgi:hypothetical protein
MENRWCGVARQRIELSGWADETKIPFSFSCLSKETRVGDLVHGDV